MSGIVKSVTPIAEQIMTNPKVSQVVAGATMFAGVGSTLGIIKDVLAIVATLAGITLTSILIYKNLKELKK
jgi:hypothetical protein